VTQAGGTALEEPVLVVDDDPGMRETLVEILMANGVLAEGAGSAASAMARLETLRAAAAVVDQRLPDAEGIELCERLKSNDPDLQAILLTGYATLETAIAAVGHLDEFLTKPVPPDQLVRVVKAALSRRRLRRENAVLVQRLRQANANLEESVAVRGRELQALTEMAQSLSAATGLVEVVGTVAASVLNVTGARGAAVYLGGGGAPAELMARAGSGEFPGQVPESVQEAFPRERDVVPVELAVAAVRLGWLCLDSPRTAGQHLLVTMATQAALAIENGRRLDRERETVERLEELSRLKSAFLASVSHELRTPLAALVGFTEVLGQRWQALAAEDVKNVLGRMTAQGERLRRLIENLLDSTSLETGTLRLTLQTVALAPVLRRVVETHPASASLQWAVGPEVTAVTADQHRLEQVLGNLLDNAERHAGSGQGPVTVAARAVDGQVEVSVHDQGPGIDPVFLPQIFEPFTQRQDPGHQSGGLGIGLHITRGIVEAMGGAIGVDSRLGLGTTFWFRLPAA
jgi:signal transduction histidine kinase